jgi:hypothetical protein
MKKHLPNELVGGFTLAGYIFAETTAEALTLDLPDELRGPERGAV